MDVRYLKTFFLRMTIMINWRENSRDSFTDFQVFERDMKTLIYFAIPKGENIICKSSNKKLDYELSDQIHDAVCLIIRDILTRGKSYYSLNINLNEDGGLPFQFRPKNHPVQGYKIVSMIIYSHDFGISNKSIRALTKRLKKSKCHISDNDPFKFDESRKRIADRWGHAISWRMSEPAVFTDSSILLNQCNQIMLAIDACKAVENAMNKVLFESGFSDYKVIIPTRSKEELESSKKKYIEGTLEEKNFSDMLFSRI